MRLINLGNSEKQLIRKCLKGERKAQRALFDRFAGKMLGVCRRYVRSQYDAEEVIFVDNLQTGYDKNKMNVTTINIPLMLQLDFSDKRSLENGFNLGFGGYAGFRTGSNGKFKYRDDNNEKVKMVTKSDYFLTDFQYGLQAQIGIAGVNFFARYGLNTLFQENRGPELTPVVFGIVL